MKRNPEGFLTSHVAQLRSRGAFLRSHVAWRRLQTYWPRCTHDSSEGDIHAQMLDGGVTCTSARPRCVHGMTRQMIKRRQGSKQRVACKVKDDDTGDKEATRKRTPGRVQSEGDPPYRQCHSPPVILPNGSRSRHCRDIVWQAGLSAGRGTSVTSGKPSSGPYWCTALPDMAKSTAACVASLGGSQCTMPCVHAGRGFDPSRRIARRVRVGGRAQGNQDHTQCG